MKNRSFNTSILPLAKVLKISFCLAACAVLLLGSGCSSTGEKPNAIERQGLACSRIICSPLNMVGFTVAECENIGPASVVLFPVICCWTLPAGAMAMGCDVITGTTEMIAWHQFESVNYPWESFNYEAAEPFCDFSKALLLAGLAGAAEGAAESYATDSSSGSSYSSSSSSSSSSYTPRSSKKTSRQRVRHSSCGGSGRCNICRGRGTVGSGITCRGCGGSKICRSCRGAGYVY